MIPSCVAGKEGGRAPAVAVGRSDLTGSMGLPVNAFNQYVPGSQDIVMRQ
jgi:hypothetical protein